MVTSSFIRWAVIGCGQIAVDKSLHGILAARGARLIALSDPLETRRSLALALATQNGLQPKVYADYRDVLADPDVDAVYISLPTGMHRDAVIAAAEAKKAILCEKPLGNSAEEVRDMVRAARTQGVPLMTAYMSRFSDVFQKTVHLIREGAIGKVTFVTAHFSYPASQYYPPGQPGGWRYTDPLGGGPLLDIGVYLAFGIREMLGERIASVSPIQCDTDAPPGSAVPDTTAAWFVTDNGTPGTFITTFSHVGLYVNFYGTKGNLLVADCFYQRPGARLELTTTDGRPPFILDTRSDPSLAHFDNYRREFEHFSHALLTQSPHQPSEDDVLSDALLLDTLKRSAPGIPVPTPAAFLA